MTDESRLILITRPRLFGKATALSMLRYFLENRISPAAALKVGFRDLFRGLSISEDTVFLQETGGGRPKRRRSREVAGTNAYGRLFHNKPRKLEHFKGYAIHRLHEYLLDGDLLTDQEKRTFEAIRDKTAPLADTTAGLRKLCTYLHRKNNKPVILLIDSFEKPTQTAFFNQYADQMQSLLHDLLLPALKDNPYLYKAVITGISVIGQEALLAELPDMRVYSILDDQRYTEFFGFLESDVRALVAETGLTAKRELLDTWYRGYDFCGTLLYNPFSVLSFLSQGGKPGFYWVQNPLTETVVQIVFTLSTAARKDFDKLMYNHSLEKVIHEDLSYEKFVTQEEPFWSLLVHYGYLVAKPKGLPELNYTVRMPNKEVREQLLDLCRKKFEGTFGAKDPKKSNKGYKPNTRVK
ncbi:unnamed protein product [Bemisia tabaci]|uniref:AAA-ATPase-like domain-containing protein n=1 Tax=Bemisia tabaci TaxID=7038 RepID=A0A9P0F8P8_BEMTA|nr:unnamed protein product [Bemisia tabaci]